MAADRGKVQPLPPNTQEYPKWMHHSSGRTCLVGTPAEESALRKGEKGWDFLPVEKATPVNNDPGNGATDKAPVVSGDDK